MIVTKDTDPEGNSGTFPVTLTGPNAYNENGTLIDDGGQHTFDPVPVGSGYALSENLAGLPYDLTSIVCNGTDVTQTTFNVGPGETINCTVTNAAKPGSVIVTKHTDPAGGTRDVPGHPVRSELVQRFGRPRRRRWPAHLQRRARLPPATRSARTRAGWSYTLESIVCGGVDVTSGNFAVAPDQTLECTVTNVRNPNPPPPNPPPPEPGGSGAGRGWYRWARCAASS